MSSQRIPAGQRILIGCPCCSQVANHKRFRNMIKKDRKKNINKCPRDSEMHDKTICKHNDLRLYEKISFRGHVNDGIKEVHDKKEIFLHDYTKAEFKKEQSRKKSLFKKISKNKKNINNEFI